MTRGKIYDLQSLQREKDRLKLMAQVKEKELQSTGNYLKMNYRNIIWSYLNPFEGNTIFAQLFQLIKSAVMPGLGSLKLDDIKSGNFKNAGAVGIGASLAMRLLKKIFKKKRTKAEAPNEGGIPE